LQNPLRWTTFFSCICFCSLPLESAVVPIQKQLGLGSSAGADKYFGSPIYLAQVQPPSTPTKRSDDIVWSAKKLRRQQIELMLRQRLNGVHVQRLQAEPTVMKLCPQIGAALDNKAYAALASIVDAYGYVAYFDGALRGPQGNKLRGRMIFFERYGDVPDPQYPDALLQYLAKISTDELAAKIDRLNSYLSSGKFNLSGLHTALSPSYEELTAQQTLAILELEAVEICRRSPSAP
jgi:hypothetical protein